MEREIGEIFELEGERYIVCEAKNCVECDFKPQNKCISIKNCLTTGKCGKRKDGKRVIFVKIVD